MESYFRLIHNLRELDEPNLSSEYYFMKVDLPTEGEAAANMISSCQDNVRSNMEDIVISTEYPAYNSELWIWVINKKSGRKVGLGIAEADKTTREGSIAWLQVLPEYRNIGIGRELVLELISCMKKMVDFITVTDRLHNPYDSQKLFRRCGFEGNDVWYIIKNISPLSREDSKGETHRNPSQE
jgi:GNAT superfamily N-acetyltransferase